MWRPGAVGQQYSLAKLYISLDAENWRQGVRGMLETFVALFKASFDLFSINFAPEEEFDLHRLMERLQAITAGDLESLSVRNRPGTLQFSIRTEFAYLGARGWHELRFVFPASADCESVFASLAKVAANCSRVAYGYARKLDADHDVSSESKMKKTLLGNIRTRVERAVDTWMENPAGIGDGALKGFYPFNLVRESKLRTAPLREVIDAYDVHPNRLSDDLSLIRLAEDQLKSLKRSSGIVSRFVRD